MSTITTDFEQLDLEREPNQTGSIKKASPLNIFRQRDFKFLWIGEAISLIGDQFYMIALPWLVLQLTGNALAMGTVLALAGVPRALFMLVGGALTDRFTPRMVMLASNLLRMVLVSSLALIIVMGQIEMWMLYMFALVFGLVDAFFYPAQNAIVPRLVNKERLQLANTIMQGTLQLSLFAGPVLAGYLITVLDKAVVISTFQVSGEMQGIGLAFAIDALTFLASAITLWMISPNAGAAQRQDEGRGENLLDSIREVLLVVWNDIRLRTFFILIAISNFLINGPLIVGIPVLANTRFPEGAAAFGMLMSTYGGGSLLGIAAAGILPRPPARRMGTVLGIVWSVLGLGVLSLGLIPYTPLAALVTLIMGAANGYVVIIFITWLQTSTQEAMLGRMMSLLMFASAGLLPLSSLLTGALISLHVIGLFVISGSLMTLLVLLMLRNPAIRSLEVDNHEVDIGGRKLSSSLSDRQSLRQQ